MFSVYLAWVVFVVSFGVMFQSIVTIWNLTEADKLYLSLRGIHVTFFTRRNGFFFLLWTASGIYRFG